MESILKFKKAVAELKLAGDLSPASDEGISKAKELGLPNSYVEFLNLMGCGPLKRSEWPFYLLEISDGPTDPLSIYDLANRDRENIQSYVLFAFDLDGDCRAFKLDDDDAVYLITVDGELVLKTHATFEEYLDYLEQFLTNQSTRLCPR